MFLRIVFVASLFLNCLSKKSIRITIDTRAPIQIINPLSPSVALGIGIFLYKWVDYFKDPKFLLLAKSIGPAYLRVGGTRADYVTFQPDETDRYFNKSRESTAQCSSVVSDQADFERHHRWAEEQENLYIEQKQLYGIQNVEKFTNLTGDEWRKLNELCECVGWKLIYGLNLLKRNGSKWDSKNAKLLIDFTEKQKYHVNWELGNEPNSYAHKTGSSLSPEQIADGFVDLKDILSQSSWWDQSMIIGPDINRIEVSSTDTYLSRFLEVAGKVMDAITFHQYYFNGKLANQSDYLNPTIANRIAKQIKALKSTVDASPSATRKLWLGETSSGYGGGAPGYSNTFIDGFLWLDKLGMTSKLGVDLVIRQTFFEGSYGLIDENFDPMPDYWLTLLYKRLISNRILGVSMQKCLTKTLCNANQKLRRTFSTCSESTFCNSMQQRHVRIYAYCAKYQNTKYHRGSVVMSFINMKNNSVRLFMEPINNRTLKADLYLLQTGVPRNLTAQSIMLNGKPIELTRDMKIPDLPPKRLPQNIFTEGIRIPYRSYGFIVLRNANVGACYE